MHASALLHTCWNTRLQTAMSSGVRPRSICSANCRWARSPSRTISFAGSSRSSSMCFLFTGSVFFAINPDGPYVPMKDSTYLPADKPTLDGTFWVDKDGKPYMVYCYEWLQALDGTIEKIELKPDLSGTIGEGKLLFRASESPWSREKDADGKEKPNKVTDGPYLFRTGTGRLGMIWTSWIYNVYTQGVAYSESGTLDGPWIQEKDPITPPNFGHGMLFQTLDGKWLMSVHSHKDVNGRYIRTPRLFEVDFSGDKLMVGKPYIP